MKRWIGLGLLAALLAVLTPAMAAEGVPTPDSVGSMTVDEPAPLDDGQMGAITGTYAAFARPSVQGGSVVVVGNYNRVAVGGTFNSVVVVGNHNSVVVIGNTNINGSYNSNSVNYNYHGGNNTYHGQPRPR
jgi:hypothetical protein